MSSKQDIWNEVLKETCNCSPDEVGNVPCDNGVICDKCSAEWIQDIYKKRLKENGY